MEVIERVKDICKYEAWFECSCRGCGKSITLWFNGGELDESHCCGYTYRLEHKRIDFVVEKD